LPFNVSDAVFLVSRGTDPRRIMEKLEESGMDWESLSEFMLSVASYCMSPGYGRRLDAAERVLRVMLEYSREKGDRKTESDCLKEMGRLFLERGRMSDAIEFYSEAARIGEELRDDRGQSLVHSEIGEILWLMGDLEGALRHTRRSYEILLNVEREAVLEDLVRMGTILFELRRYEEAYRRYQEALRIAEKLEDFEIQCVCLWESGSALKRMGRLEEALESLLGAAAVKRGVSDTLGEALCRVEAGNVLLLLGRTEEALEQFNTALRLSKKGGEQFGIAVALFHIGVSKIILGNDKGVVEAFERSMRIFRKRLSYNWLAVALNTYLYYLFSVGERARAEEISKEASGIVVDDRLDEMVERSRVIHEKIEELRRILKAGRVGEF